MPETLYDWQVYCAEARKKYLRLGREIEQVSDPDVRSDLMHTHSKLGIFLAAGLGPNWTEDVPLPPELIDGRERPKCGIADGSEA